MGSPHLPNTTAAVFSSPTPTFTSSLQSQRQSHSHSHNHNHGHNQSQGHGPHAQHYNLQHPRQNNPLLSAARNMGLSMTPKTPTPTFSRLHNLANRESFSPFSSSGAPASQAQSAILLISDHKPDSLLSSSTSSFSSSSSSSTLSTETSTVATKSLSNQEYPAASSPLPFPAALKDLSSALASAIATSPSSGSSSTSSTSLAASAIEVASFHVLPGTRTASPTDNNHKCTTCPLDTVAQSQVLLPSTTTSPEVSPLAPALTTTSSTSPSTMPPSCPNCSSCTSTNFSPTRKSRRDSNVILTNGSNSNNHHHPNSALRNHVLSFPNPLLPSTTAISCSSSVSSSRHHLNHLQPHRRLSEHESTHEEMPGIVEAMGAAVAGGKNGHDPGKAGAAGGRPGSSTFHHRQNSAATITTTTGLESFGQPSVFSPSPSSVEQIQKSDHSPVLVPLASAPLLPAAADTDRSTSSAPPATCSSTHSPFRSLMTASYIAMQPLTVAQQSYLPPGTMSQQGKHQQGPQGQQQHFELVQASNNNNNNDITSTATEIHRLDSTEDGNSETVNTSSRSSSRIQSYQQPLRQEDEAENEAEMHSGVIFAQSALRSPSLNRPHRPHHLPYYARRSSNSHSHPRTIRTLFQDAFSRGLSNTFASRLSMRSISATGGFRVSSSGPTIASRSSRATPSWNVIRLLHTAHLLYLVPVATITIARLVVTESVCDEQLYSWLTVQAAIFLIQILCACAMLQRQVASSRMPLIDPRTRILMIVFMIWTVIGVGFLGADQKMTSCPSSDDPIYNLSFKVIVFHLAMIAFYFLPCSSMFMGRVLPLSISSSLSRTATKPMIDGLDTRDMAEGMFGGDVSEATCAICLGEYEIGEPVRFLPCHHHFHGECVDQWLMTDKSCPLCKHDIDRPTSARASRLPLTCLSAAAALLGNASSTNLATLAVGTFQQQQQEEEENEEEGEDEQQQHNNRGADELIMDMQMIVVV